MWEPDVPASSSMGSISPEKIPGESNRRTNAAVDGLNVEDNSLVASVSPHGRYLDHPEYVKHKRRKSVNSSSSLSSATGSANSNSLTHVEPVTSADNHKKSSGKLNQSLPQSPVNETRPKLRWGPLKRLLLRRQDSTTTTSTTASSAPSSPPAKVGFQSPSSHNCQSPLLRKTEVHVKSNGKLLSTETSLLPNDTYDQHDCLVEMVAVATATSTSFNKTDGEVSSPPPGEVVTADGRETWDKRIDFLLSIVGFAVDLANVWRFPFLCYRNGGGAFLIPYFLMLIFGALPLFYMELILGQYHRQGPISVWNICPFFKGTGYCAVLVAYFVSFYYNVIIGWSFYFMFASMTFELPWLHCNNSWNSINCVENFVNQTVGMSSSNGTSTRSSAAKEYFERSVLELHTSDGVHDLGAPKWQLCLCVLLVYIILYLAIFKGVKGSGKVVWVTATMPYVVLTILLIRGLLLPGAAEGILYFIRPDMTKLTNSQVWVDAAVQVFYSVGAGFGVHLTFASYNTFNNNCYRDCLITTAINSFTSLFSGLVIFTYLGYMAHTQNTDISKVATDGPGLVFEVYPEAISTLPGSNIWAFLFFFMLITLGMDSTMGGLESVITGIKDEFHSFFSKFRFSREIFTAVIMVVSFLVSITNLTRGGGYMLHWFDTYSAGISLLCSALFEAIGISWFYGLDRFCKDVQEMLGTQPAIFWRICWKFLSPFFLLVVIISAIINQPTLKYNNYIYPPWATTVGWTFALVSVSVIPIFAIVIVFKQKGCTLKEKIAYCISPPNEQQRIMSTGYVSRFHAKHWIKI
ncbi:hypothetical protein CHUAL_003365 [Chamberlinius hualienensis]